MPGPGGNITVTGGTVSLQNSIVANADGAAADPDISGTVASLDYNLIQNPSGATITGATANNVLGADPLLQPLGMYNGSPTQILPPSASSPAINVIPNAGGCNGASITADQRGVSRPQSVGGLCDIGAVEYNFALPPVPHKTRTAAPSKTPTSSPTLTPSKTQTPSSTPTRTPSLTRTATATSSPTPSATATHTSSPVPSVTLSNTPGPSALPVTFTPSPTAVSIKD
ncbi:MAG: choice-of-anchor Q domain-containing protein [Aggregatilineales bacterium]